MKTLSKVKLINWHTYQNETIPIIGNVLVSGENGSGKSTLLDAIQFVLTAGNTKFNQAADNNNKRTLDGYIRGKLGFDNKKYLRNGYVISYIALEFFDSDTKRHDVLGVVLELAEGNTNPNKTFFTMKQEILDDYFLEDNRPKLSQKFLSQDFVQKMLSQAQMKSAIQAILGLAPTGKYFELLPKALAFKPIPDLENFVSTFLLKEDRVELDHLRENVYQFRRLEEIIKEQQQKKDELEKLEKVYTNYQEQTREKILLHLAKQFAKIVQNKKDKKRKEKELTKINLNLEELKSNYNVINLDIKDLEKIVSDYHKSLEQDENYLLKNRLEENLSKTKELIETRQKEKKDFSKKLNEIATSLKEFAWAKKLNGLLEDMNISLLKEEINKASILKEEELEKLKSLYLEIIARKDKVKKQVDEIFGKLSILEKGKFSYSKSITTLQTEIETVLGSRHQKEIIVKPLCEYLKITDENWRNAIEGYLNTQKFDLIIDPIYFDEALLIYEKIKKEKNVEGVGLVNIKKIEERECLENSLFNFVTSTNPFALTYAKYLLGQVVCCEKVEDLKKNKIAITKTCMTYKNHTARQMKKILYEDPYIGREALNLQKEKYEKKYQEAKDLYHEIDSTYKDVLRKRTLLENTDFRMLKPYVESLEEYLRLKENQQSIEKDLNELVLDGLFSNIEEQLSKKSLELTRKKNTLSELNNEKIKKGMEKENIEQEVLSITNEISILEEELDKEANDHLELKDKFLNICKKIENDELTNTELMEKENEIAKTSNQLETSILKFEMEFKNKYEFDEEISVEVAEKYLEELYRIREWDLNNYKSQSIEAKEKCQTSFHEDFICQLKDKILSAEDSLKELNKALKSKRFGKERYEFTFKRSNDYEMGMYYDIIMSDELSNKNTIFETNLTDEYRLQLDTLFEKLMADTSIVATEKALEQYTDYRNYMSYDIKITNDDGETYSFKEVLKEKSGGETQTPFYVLIAASFEQLLRSKRRTSSVGCFVMFDEAFNNMDESRIEAMMSFYNQLNIQLMIAVPPQRVPTISPYVDTNLALIKNKNHTFVKPMIRVDYEETI